MGHIHIGYDNPDTETSAELIKMMDIILGLPSLFLCKDTRRRRLYGKAGAFRFKPFGVEYRTLSNFWISDDSLIRWAYDNTLKAINLINKGYSEDIINKYSELTRIAINDANEELATEIINGVEELIKTKTTSLI